jgi:mRNA interferase MazF
VFVVVSRPILIESRYATVVCAPIHSTRSGLATQVDLGTEAGLKHASAIHCDALMSIPKGALTDFVGRLSTEQTRALDAALKVALALED